MVALNQSYKRDITLKEYPNIGHLKEKYERYCLESTEWGKYGRS